jgi:hypothetical protein
MLYGVDSLASDERAVQDDSHSGSAVLGTSLSAAWKTQRPCPFRRPSMKTMMNPVEPYRAEP